MPPHVHPEVYEAVDPARTMPKGLVFGALGLLVVVVLALSWLSNRSLQPDEAVAEAANVAAPGRKCRGRARRPPHRPRRARWS